MPSNTNSQNIDFGTIIFHDAANGLEVLVRCNRRPGENFSIFLPIDLGQGNKYGGNFSTDPDTGYKSVTVLTREEYDAHMATALRNWEQYWGSDVRAKFKSILQNNSLVFNENGTGIQLNGFIRQLHDLIKNEATRATNAEDSLQQQINFIRTGSNTSTSVIPASYNLTNVNTRLSNLERWQDNMYRYNLPIGTVVATMNTSYFSSSYWSRCDGSSSYAVSFPEFVRTMDGLRDDTITLVRDNDNPNNINNCWDELMSSTTNLYSRSADRPSRLFMSLKDMCKFMGGSTARGKLRNASNNPYSVAYGGNSDIVKNMISEYYLAKYGTDSEYASKFTFTIPRGSNVISIRLDRQGFLYFETSEGRKSVDIGNVNTSNGIISVITIKNGGLTLGDFVYLKKDDGNLATSRVMATDDVIRSNKDMELLRAVTYDEELGYVETSPLSDVEVQVLTMPTSNEISPMAGARATTFDMTSVGGRFLGSMGSVNLGSSVVGGSPGGFLDWTIPDFDMYYSTGRSERARGGTDAHTTLYNGNTKYMLSSRTNYTNVNTTGLFYPSNYQINWYIKRRMITS